MMDDDAILAIVRDEMTRAIGFDEDETLSGERARALQYLKGELPDMPAPAGRSKAVSTDVRDAIETVMPDLIEVLANEAVVEFPPTGPDDEEQAELETEYVRNVFFEDNSGFAILYASIKDALTLRLGVVKVWAEREEREERREVQGLPRGAAIMAQEQGLAVEDYAEDAAGERFTVVKRSGVGKVRVAAWPAEDFAYARDAATIADAPYVAARERVRAFDLLERGYDAERVAQLTPYGHVDGAVEDARDLSGMDDATDRGGIGDHRLVEVVEHYVRVRNEGGGLKIVRVVTDGAASILLDQEEVGAIPFAAGSPYPMPHRVMGQSVADLVMEVQRIKTALLRMALDSGYFALNQRAEISEQDASESTVADFLNNTPAAPIRSKTGQAVRPIPAPGLGYDVWGALEAVTAMGENRTGIVRAAQGLNSDALHETATGQGVLQAAAQKRVRLIARILAEVMIGPAFKLVHGACREVIREPVPKRLTATWRDDVIPAQWREREDITVDVGVGSGGRAEDIAYTTRILEFQERAIQGGLGGVLVTPANIHAAFTRLLRAMGVKNVESLVTDPAKAKVPEGEDKPDPAMAEAQAKLALKREEAALDAQIARERLQVEMQIAREKMQFEADLAREKMQLEAELGLMRDATAPGLPAQRPGGSLTS